jgi:hypothetical protein
MAYMRLRNIEIQKKRQTTVWPDSATTYLPLVMENLLGFPVAGETVTELRREMVDWTGKIFSFPLSQISA